MRKPKKRISAFTANVVLLILVFLGSTPGFAQQEEDDTSTNPQGQDSTGANQQPEDDTGTNPINFTYDARFYMESVWFNGGSFMAPTFEFRLPLGRDLANLTNDRLGKFNDLGKRYALRLKFRPQQNLNLDDPGGNPAAGFNISGIGDMDFRFLAAPYVTQKWGVAAGLEAYFPTATNDLLGTGKYALRPQVFLGFFGLMGKNSIFAPGYLYVFDVAGNSARPSIRQHQIDMYFVWLLANMRHWLIVNPAINLDVENDLNIYVIDVEWGYMIPPLPGASVYLRPGFGLGEDRPFDATFEFGLKFIWR